MRTKLTLTLADAKAIAAAAEAYAQSQQLAASIAVVDESTYLHHLLRMDGAPYRNGQGTSEGRRTARSGWLRRSRAGSFMVASAHAGKADEPPSARIGSRPDLDSRLSVARASLPAAAWAMW